MGLIVVATDGSPGAEVALDEAIGIASSTGDQIAVVTVWRALQGDFGMVHPPTAGLTELLESERAHAEATLERAASRVRDAGLEVETHLLTGDPVEEVCRFAQEHEARLISVGTHGHGPMVRLLVGSVSAGMIRRAPCPVLVAHERLPADRRVALSGRSAA